MPARAGAFKKRAYSGFFPSNQAVTPPVLFTPSSTFDGSSQNFSIADNASLSWGNRDLYFAGWVKFNAVNVQQCVLAKGTSLAAAASFEYAIWLNSSGIIKLQFSTGSATTTASWGTALVANTWYFVEGYYASSIPRMRLSVNRGTDISIAQTGGPVDGANAFCFGNSTAANYLNGNLYSWAFYTGNPSSTVRDFLYNSGNGRTFTDLSGANLTNLVSFWNFGNASGNLVDQNSGGNDMTASISHPGVA